MFSIWMEAPHAAGCPPYWKNNPLHLSITAFRLHQSRLRPLPTQIPFSGAPNTMLGTLYFSVRFPAIIPQIPFRKRLSYSTSTELFICPVSSTIFSASSVSSLQYVFRSSFICLTICAAFFAPSDFRPL